MKEQELLQLEEQVRLLTEWKKNRQSERLKFPLDYKSRVALDYWKNPNFNGLLVATGKTLGLDFINLITPNTCLGIEVSINGKINQLLLAFKLLPFTANPGTDFITNSNGAHNMVNGQSIAFTTNGILPDPLDPGPIYFVVNRTSTTFQVSLTSGGSPINITDSGSGNHYYAIL